MKGNHWKLLAVFLLAMAAFLIEAQLMPTSPRAGPKEDQLSIKAVSGMKFVFWIQKPEEMQVMKEGRWVVVRPEEGATHHVAVRILDSRNGHFIGYVRVYGNFVNMETQEAFQKEFPACFSNDLHHGTDASLAPGRYRLSLFVKRIEGVREGIAFYNDYRHPVADFEFRIK